MVDIKEYAIIYRSELTENGLIRFIPESVMEGYYNEEYDLFVGIDGVAYLPIECIPENVFGFAYNLTLKFPTEGINEEQINLIKEDLLNKVKRFEYIKDLENNIVTLVDKETGETQVLGDEDLETNSKNQEAKQEELKLTPLEIETQVKKTIKGQDEAVRKIVTALWTTIKFRNLRKKNMLILGPSGVGKTAIFEKIKKILNVPVIIFSVPGLSQAGYVGRNTDDILTQLYYESGEDVETAEKAIVILDEIDKLATRGEGSVSTTGVQNELLKLIEGCKRYIDLKIPGMPGVEIDTSKMIFIGTGAFQELHEKPKPTIGFNSKESVSQNKINTDKLVQYGLKRELIGRLPIVVELNNLGKEELKDIILNSDESELIATINSLNELGVEIENIEEVIDLIVDDAISNQIGARGLILTINNLFQEIFYEVANDVGKYEKVIIGPNIINNKRDFTLVEKKQQIKKRVKTIQG